MTCAVMASTWRPSTRAKVPLRSTTTLFIAQERARFLRMAAEIMRVFTLLTERIMERLEVAQAKSTTTPCMIVGRMVWQEELAQTSLALLTRVGAHPNS